MASLPGIQDAGGWRVPSLNPADTLRRRGDLASTDRQPISLAPTAQWVTSGEDSGSGRQPRQRISVPPLKPQHRVKVPSLETNLKGKKAKGRPNGWRYVGRKEETRLKSNGRQQRMENTKYGRRREGRWTPIWAKAQDTRANPNSWETHLVRKKWDIGLLRAVSPRFMMMFLVYLYTLISGKYSNNSGTYSF